MFICHSLGGIVVKLVRYWESLVIKTKLSDIDVGHQSFKGFWGRGQ